MMSQVRVTLPTLHSISSDSVCWLAEERTELDHIEIYCKAKHMNESMVSPGSGERKRRIFVEKKEHVENVCENFTKNLTSPVNHSKDTVTFCCPAATSSCK